MRRSIAILLLAALVLAGCSAKTEAPAYRQVDAQEAIRLMETEEDYILLDVRTQQEYEQEHIPGAVCLPNESIGGTAPDMLPDRGQLILIYCRSGNRSKQAAGKLAALGYGNLVEFGGIIDWPGETVTG